MARTRRTQQQRHTTLLGSEETGRLPLAVAYCRISGDSERIVSQERLLYGYARRKGITVSHWFVDRGTRRGFLAMLAYLDSNPDCRAVLIERVDRLHRSFSDIAAFYALVRQNGLRIHFVSQRVIMTMDARGHLDLVRATFSGSGQGGE